MKYIVTGRDRSGKSTFKQEAERLIGERLLSSKVSFTECCAHNFFNKFDEEDIIIVINTAAILCHKRSKIKNFDNEEHKRQDQFLSYVTELPNCTIIHNDGSLDEFRVRIKKFIKSL